MYGRDSAAGWDEALSNFSEVGMISQPRSIWQFADAVKRTSAATIRTGSPTRPCQVGGGGGTSRQPCADVATAVLAARNVSVQAYFTYSQGTQFSAGALTPCAGVEGSGEYHLPPGTAAGGSQNEYWVLVLPVHVTGSSTLSANKRSGQECLLEAGSEVSIVVVYALGMMYTPTPYDDLKLMLDATDRHHMEAVVPMPGLPADPTASWRLDAKAVPVFLQLVERTTLDLCLRGFAARPSLLGVYQSHETPVSNNAFWVTTQYTAYDQAARAVHAVMASDMCSKERPTRLKFAISPYWMTNKIEAPMGTLANSVGGIAALAATDIDIVAPQEGRGTGKVGCYWPHEANLSVSEVDPNFGRYSNVQGNATFASQFWASTFEVFHGGRAAVDRANQGRAHKVEYWMNLEAFEQTSLNVCGQGADRTNKSRTDRSLMFGAGAVDRVVSFMWDPFYTCSPKGFNGSTLLSDIKEDIAGPLVLGVTIAIRAATAIAVLTGTSLCSTDTTKNSNM